MNFKSKVISLLIPYAKNIEKEYSLLPSITIAQAILETGWLKYCKGNNLFGIKWTKKSGYNYEELQTYEWINRIKTPLIYLFRKYKSYEDSFNDYGELLTKSSRYRPVIDSKNYYEGCHKLYTCGYCTDPDYPNKLIAIIEENELYKYDPIPKKVIHNKVNKIKDLQEKLNLLKIYDFDDKALTVDGLFGPRTRSALKKIQRICKINVDGIPGEETVKLVDAICLYHEYISKNI